MLLLLPANTHTLCCCYQLTHTHSVSNQIQQCQEGVRAKKSTLGQWLCTRKRAFQLLAFLAGLVNSVQGYTCSSNADCQYRGCNDKSCTCSSSDSRCINGFWTGFSDCKNGIWDAECVSAACAQNTPISFYLSFVDIPDTAHVPLVYQVYTTCSHPSKGMVVLI